MNINFPSFNRHISKTVQLSGNTIVLFVNTNKVEHLFSDVQVPTKSNVCSLSSEGTILWWIQDFVEHLKEKNPALTEQEIDLLWKFRSYTNIWIENDILKAFSSRGYFCTVDPLTGKIIEMEDE